MLSKLGVSSRREAARRVEELELAAVNASLLTSEARVSNVAGMEYVRRLDRSALSVDDFDAVNLVDNETAWVVGVGVPPGWVRPFPHVHESDQLYWIIEGELTVVLDGVEHVAGPSSLVCIPAGVVHKNRNDGTVPELHLDLLVPAPNRFKPGSTPASDDERGPGTGWVRALDDVRVRVEPRARLRARSAGVARQWLFEHRRERGAASRPSRWVPRGTSTRSTRCTGCSTGRCTSRSPTRCTTSSPTTSS